MTSRVLLALSLGLFAACSTPQPAPPMPAATPVRAAGYLGPDELDVLAVVAPAPVGGSARYEADRKIFLATRTLEGSPRWRMADDDAQLGSAKLLQHFACALDAEIEPAAVPQTLRLLQRSVRDAGNAMNVVKDHYQRLRPYHIDTGPLCRAVEDLGDTFDYPSGHAMAGWAWAMALSQLAPDRAAPLLARGRAIGESRIVCGVHNSSAVDASRVAATAVMVALYAKPEWQADAEGARTELAKVRTNAHRPDSRACAVETALIAEPIG